MDERKFKEDIRWKMKPLDLIVRSILILNTLSVDRKTPGYIVRKEIKREKLRVEILALLSVGCDSNKIWGESKK